jgi:hypothetical protein
VEGEWIVPVPGAGWETYHPLQRPSFYLDLINLYPIQGPGPIADAVRLWGLLGLYQQEVRQLRFRGPAEGDLLAEPGALFDAAAALTPEARREVDVWALRREDTAEDWFPEIPFAPLFARYFPGLKWPADLQTEGVDLWDHLHEPLVEFCEAVERLHKTFAIGALWSNGERADDVVASLNHRFQIGLGGLRSRVEFTPSGGGSVLVPELPSLLAAAYYQMLLDVQAGRYLRFCRNERCGRALVTERLNAYYCSKRCMEAARKREYRRRTAG